MKVRIRNEQIVNGEIPAHLLEGATELSISYCGDLKTIANIPASVKKLSLTGCEALEAILNLPEGVEEIWLNHCNNLRTITNIPASVKKLNFFGHEALETLPPLPEGIEEIDLGSCKNLRTIINIPASVKKLSLIEYEALETMPLLPEGIEEMKLNYCKNLRTITNIPASVKGLNLIGCEVLETLPHLSKGVEEIWLNSCKNLRTITNIPVLVKELNLFECEALETLPILPKGIKYLDIEGCNNLNFTPGLIESLTKLREDGCSILYPSHFKPNNQPTLTEEGLTPKSKSSFVTKIKKEVGKSRTETTLPPLKKTSKQPPNFVVEDYGANTPLTRSYPSANTTSWVGVQHGDTRILGNDGKIRASKQECPSTKTYVRDMSTIYLRSGLGNGSRR